MKKRIAAMLLCGLLLTNVTACNEMSGNDDGGLTSEETTNEVMDETEQNNVLDNSVDILKKEETTGRNEIIEDLSLNELREQLGCYVNNESTENLKQLIQKGESKIQVEHDRNSSNVFYITVHQNETEYKTTVSLSNGIKTPDVYCGFTNEQNGYIIIFHMEGYAVSPMDDIEIACVLKTFDGGKTWNTTEYQDFAVSNSREYITAACFFTEQIGFFTARYCNTDHFGPRTYWTVDGGKTWTRMPRLDIPDVLGPYGLKGYDFSSEISDVELIDGAYLITVRICQGYSCKVDGKSGMYIQYFSTDLENWTLVK